MNLGNILRTLNGTRKDRGRRRKQNLEDRDRRRKQNLEDRGRRRRKQNPAELSKNPINCRRLFLSNFFIDKYIFFQSETNFYSLPLVIC